MANPEHVALVKKGVAAINEWRKKNPRVQLDLPEANLSEAKFSYTAIGMCNLSLCTGLDTVKHQKASSVGVGTLVDSFRGAGNRLTLELTSFFRGTGVPDEFLKALPHIVGEIMYYNCFISYGQPDKDFAEGLVKDLEGKGISCWLYSMDSTPGERTQREIGQRRREAEKMIVICSADSLVRDGVLKEIEEQIDEDPDRIVPVSLDELWKHPGFRIMRSTRDLKPLLIERNYANFGDPSSYEESLERLLNGLRRKDST